MAHSSPYDMQGMEEIDFEWDDQKATANVKKHGVSFEDAAAVFFDGMALTEYDHEHSQGEERWFTLGFGGNGQLLAVSHTYFTNDEHSVLLRIISARAATRAERRLYEQKQRWQVHEQPSIYGDIMSTELQATQDAGDMSAEIDFGRAIQPQPVRVRMPGYLDATVQATLMQIAKSRGMQMSDLANDLLRNEIALLLGC